MADDRIAVPAQPDLDRGKRPGRTAAAPGETASRRALWVSILLGSGGLGALLIAFVPPLLTNEPPEARLTVNPARGAAPLEVFADAAGSADPDDAPLRYAWYLDGDLRDERGSFLRLEIAEPGDHTLRVEVGDGRAVDDAVAAIHVDPRPPGGAVAVASRFETAEVPVSRGVALIGPETWGLLGDGDCEMDAGPGEAVAVTLSWTLRHDRRRVWLEIDEFSVREQGGGGTRIGGSGVRRVLFEVAEGSTIEATAPRDGTSGSVAFEAEGRQVGLVTPPESLEGTGLWRDLAVRVDSRGGNDCAAVGFRGDVGFAVTVRRAVADGPLDGPLA